jgi:hypothetical protein
VTGPRVLLMTLAERTSGKDNVYLSGWLGKARLVGFKAKELDQYGNEVWEIYAQEPEPKADSDRPRVPTRGQRTHDRSRDAGRARAAGEAIVRELRQPRMPDPAASWLDDSEAAIRDLVEGPGR